MKANRPKKTTKCIRCEKRIRKPKPITFDFGNKVYETNFWGELPDIKKEDLEEMIKRCRTELGICWECRTPMIQHLTLLSMNLQSNFEWRIFPKKGHFIVVKGAKA